MSEVYDNLSAVPESSAYVLTSVNGASHLVTVNWSANHQAGAVPANMTYSPLGTGTDGAAAVLADYQAGLIRLDPVDDISVLCIPDEVRLGQLRGDLRDNCELNRYRFAIQQVNENQGDVGGFVSGALAGYPDSSYVGLYYPWVNVVNGATGEIIKIPPGGHVAGIYARTDDERGVHKAPANEEVRGLLLADSGDIRPLEFTITKGEQDDAQPARGQRASATSGHAGRGIRVWGARTRSSATRVEVRERPPAVHLRGEVDRRRAPSGSSSSRTTSRTGPRCGAASRTSLSGSGASGALMGPTAGRGVLRQVRPHHDDPGRHRQRPADLLRRHRAGQARRVRHLPHQPEDG